MYFSSCLSLCVVSWKSLKNNKFFSTKKLTRCKIRLLYLTYSSSSYSRSLEFSLSLIDTYPGARSSSISSSGTPTKRQVSKRQVSKRLVSKRPVSKRQVYKTSGLQNVRFQNVWFQNVRFQNVHKDKSFNSSSFWIWYTY
jgi:hypothetical protein